MLKHLFQPSPKLLAELDQATLQPLFDRFIRAGWITGSIDHPKYYLLEFTPLGKERMRKLGEVVRPFGDRILDRARRPSVMAYPRMLYHRCMAQAALYPPRFSYVESQALMALAIVEDRRRRGIP